MGINVLSWNMQGRTVTNGDSIKDKMIYFAKRYHDVLQTEVCVMCFQEAGDTFINDRETEYNNIRFHCLGTTCIEDAKNKRCTIAIVVNDKFQDLDLTIDINSIAIESNARKVLVLGWNNLKICCIHATASKLGAGIYQTVIKKLLNDSINTNYLLIGDFNIEPPKTKYNQYKFIKNHKKTDRYNFRDDPFYVLSGGTNTQGKETECYVNKRIKELDYAIINQNMLPNEGNKYVVKDFFKNIPICDELGAFVSDHNSIHIKVKRKDDMECE